MSISNERQQSDLYHFLFEKSKLVRSRPNIAKSFYWHDKFVEPRKPGDDSFLWCLLRFREDGILHSIHRASDFSEDSESELTQILTTRDECSFQVFVRRCGHGAKLTAGDIRALNKAWQIPGWLWITILMSPNERDRNTAGADSERFALISTEVRSLRIDENHLYIPNVNLGNTKSAIIFLCRNNISNFEWSVDIKSSESDRTKLGLAEYTSDVMLGEYGMLAWIVNQAFRRQYSTEKDFIFLCVEALLKPMVLKLYWDKLLLHGFTSEGRVNTDEVSNKWSERMTNLITCQDVIRALPSWIEDVCLEVVVDEKAEMRARILRQYEHKIVSQVQAMDLFKHRLELAFYSIGEKMGSETVNETKFNKILAIIAIVYLPVTIASSIFGMNVQELNGQGVSIRWFVVAIFVALGALLVFWLFFVFVTSQRDAIKDKWRDSMRNKSSSYEPREWPLRFWFVGLTRERIFVFWPSRILASLMGFRDASLRWIRLKSRITARDMEAELEDHDPRRSTEP